MSKEIDELMDADPLGLSERDINDIIAYHRANRTKGPKPKKEEGPKVELDLEALGIVKKVDAKPVRRV